MSKATDMKKTLDTVWWGALIAIIVGFLIALKFTKIGVIIMLLGMVSMAATYIFNIGT